VQFEQIAELLFQTSDQVAVKLDGVQRRLGRRETLDQRFRQRAQSRPDFDHALAALRTDHVDNRIDDAQVDQKILSEALAREMALVLSA